MAPFILDPYQSLIANAFSEFWDVRDNQLKSIKTNSDTGNRGAVTGGKQLDGFLALLRQVSLDMGVPEECIYLKANHLPGYFRPTKNWDFLILSPSGRLIALAEFKSQVGSFGNNFNNRTEEALGSSVDFWTAFRENVFPGHIPPWAGYLFVVEKCERSTTPVKIAQPYFPVMPEFLETSYIDRYTLFCKRLMLERHYSATSLVWTSQQGEFGDVSPELSLQLFLFSLMGHLQSKRHEFS